MNKNHGVAAGKTRQTSNKNGLNRQTTVRNENATAEMLKRIDDGWRNFFLKRSNRLPHVPCTYLITHDGGTNDFSGIGPL